jgi:hypothetical protein
VRRGRAAKNEALSWAGPFGIEPQVELYIGRLGRHISHPCDHHLRLYSIPLNY